MIWEEDTVRNYSRDMRHGEQFVLWLTIGLFFVLWTLRVLFLPAPETENFFSFANNTSLRILIFLCPFVFLTVFVCKEALQDAFAIHQGTRTGWILAISYSLSLVLWEALHHVISFPHDAWALVNFPFAPIIEELVFRGYMFTHLLKFTGKLETILITSVLFTLIHFPGWIFLSGLQGEPFLTRAGGIFIFSLVQGVIRLYAKSVLPNIFVHLVNNLVA